MKTLIEFTDKMRLYLDLEESVLTIEVKDNSWTCRDAYIMLGILAKSIDCIDDNNLIIKVRLNKIEIESLSEESINTSLMIFRIFASYYEMEILSKKIKEVRYSIDETIDATVVRMAKKIIRVATSNIKDHVIIEN